ncbi:MAG: hypothetical protein AABX44_00595 [Nanoarchaeota archaeon]
MVKRGQKPSRKKSEAKPKIFKKSEKKSAGKLLGEVSNYFEHVGVAAIKLDAELKVGDKIRVVGGEVNFEQNVESMQIRHEKVTKAKKGDEIGIKIKEKVRKGYNVFKV